MAKEMAGRWGTPGDVAKQSRWALQGFLKLLLKEERGALAFETMLEVQKQENGGTLSARSFLFLPEKTEKHSKTQSGTSVDKCF